MLTLLCIRQSRPSPGPPSHFFSTKCASHHAFALFARVSSRAGNIGHFPATRNTAMKARILGSCLLGFLSSAASQAQKYDVKELPLLPGGSFSFGSGINNSGQ